MAVLEPPKKENDAVEVRAIRKQTKTAVTQLKLSRGLRTPVYQHSNSTSITRNYPMLARRTRCFQSREVGHDAFSARE